MPYYNLKPTHYNGTDIQTSPFATNQTFFDVQNGPMGSSDPTRAVNAAVTGLGDRDVRDQPQSATWEVHFYLADSLEATRDSALIVWSRFAGNAYLRVSDGASAAYRVAARVLAVRRIDTLHYVAVLAVPNPTMEANATSAPSQNGTSSPINLAVTNPGNRHSRPAIKITVNSGKEDDPAVGEQNRRRGFFVNRALDPWPSYPVHLYDTGGADGTLDTTLLYDGGAAIRNSINQGGGINSSVTTIPVDSAVGGGLPAGGGLARIDTEQIYYAANSGTSLTGVVRGVGGTAPAVAHADNAEVRYCTLLSDFSDVRAWVNGQALDAYPSAFNTAASRLWANISAPARVALTPARAMTATDPANSGELVFLEGVASLPDRGFVACENELIGYTARDIANGKITGLRRAMWGTTAAAHTLAQNVFGNAMPTVTAFGRFTSPAEPNTAPLERRPCLQLKSSTNALWRYGDEADDALTVFWDPAYPDRTAMWLPERTPASDLVSSLVRLESWTTRVAWGDGVPSAGLYYDIPRLALVLPQRARAHASTTVTYDVQKRRSLRARILGEAEDGQVAELVDAQDSAGALTAGVSNGYGVPLRKLMLGAVCGAVTGDGIAQSSSAIITGVGVTQDKLAKFTLAQATAITAVQLYLLKTAATNAFTFSVDILDDTGGEATPQNGKRLITFNQGGPTSTASVATGYTLYQWGPQNNVVIRLPAGTYWLRVHKTSDPALPDSMNIALDYPYTGSVTYSQDAAGYYSGLSMWHRILHSHEGPVQEEVSQIGESLQAYFDKLLVYGNDGALAGVNGTPYVWQEGGTGLGNGGLYHCTGAIQNATTGDIITLDIWMTPGDSIVIDCEEKTVTWYVSTWTGPPQGSIALSGGSADEWLTLAPGSNSLSYSEVGLGDVTMTITHRAAKT